MDTSSHKSGQTIFDVAAACSGLFSDLRLNGDVIFTELEGEERRFGRWANSLRVFSKANTNLDAQLRATEFAQLRDMVLLLLVVLRENLALAIQSSQGGEGLLDTARFGIDGSLKRLEKIASTIFNASPASLTRRVIAYTKHQEDFYEVSSHFTLAILRRYRGLASEVLPALIPLHILPSAEIITEERQLGFFAALVKSSVVRHYRLKYELRNKPRQPREGHAKAQTGGESGSLEDEAEKRERAEEPTPMVLDPRQYSGPLSTVQKTRSESAAEPLSIQLASVQKALNHTDPDPGCITEKPTPSEADVAEYPRRPKRTDAGETVMCPICNKALSDDDIATEDTWRQHVDNDIKPFACIADDCVSDFQFFDSRSAWIDHMHKAHTRNWTRYLYSTQVWVCPVCRLRSREVFWMKCDMEESLREHIKCMHADVETADLQYMTGINGLRQYFAANICPLCEELYEERPRVNEQSRAPGACLAEHEKHPPASEASGTKSSKNTEKVRFDDPTRTNNEAWDPTRGNGPSLEVPKEETILTGVEKCIARHLKAMSLYFLNRFIEDEYDLDNKEDN